MGFLIPAALGLGAVGSFLNSRSQANQQKDQANMYNNWLKQYQGTGQNLFNSAQAAGWNPYGPSVATSNSTTNSSGGSNTSFSNRPVITGEYAPIDAAMRSIIQGRLSSPSSLPAGYAQNAIRG